MMDGIYIRYLGTFELLKDDEIIIRIKSKKSRVKKLLGLLLLEKDFQFADSELVDRIWSDESLSNSENALTNLVYLTRKTLKEADEKAEFIIRDESKYIWNPQIKVYSDVQEIDDYYKKMRSDIEEKERIILGRKIKALYRGDLAEGFGYEAWWFPMSEYYNKIFIKASLLTCDLLEAEGFEENYEEIIEVATKASRYDLGNDRCYVCIFRALKALDKKYTIVKYYESLSNTYNKKFGESLCSEIKKIYDWATRNEEFTFDDLNELTESLKERSKCEEITGAFYCDKVMFKNMVHFIFRNSIRNQYDIVVMLITMYELNITLSVDERENKMDALEEIIINSLRKDDILSRYSANQFLIMPFKCKKESIGVVDKRITANYNKKFSDSNIALDIVNFAIDESGYQLLY